MSTKEENVRAIHSAREFLFDLLRPKTTPKVPLAIRKRASDILKHYPISDKKPVNGKSHTR